MAVTWRTSEADTLEAKAASIAMAEAALSDALETLERLEQRQVAATLDVLAHARERYAKRARLLRAEP